MLVLLLLGGRLLSDGKSRTLRSSSSIRHMPLTKDSRSREPDWSGSQSVQMSRNLEVSSLEQVHIRFTACPSNLSSEPTSSVSSVLSELPFPVSCITNTFSSGLVMRSTESPLQPAAFRTLRPAPAERVFEGESKFDLSALRLARTLATKTASYRCLAA